MKSVRKLLVFFLLTAVFLETSLGKTIDVKGIVDSYEGTCQIKVFAAENITIN